MRRRGVGTEGRNGKMCPLLVFQLSGFVARQSGKNSISASGMF